MKFALLIAITTIALIFTSSAQAAAPVVGEMAPDFTATDSNGNEHKLSNFIGKIVVLEWTNHNCPYVVKHYSSGNMQKIQAQATGKGVIWLRIHSSAKGKQGYVTGEQANEIAKEQGSNATFQLLDSSGKIGRLYDAKTTPNMFVIDKEGKLAYAGAIDSDSNFRPESIKGATNYVMEAINALNAGKKIKVSNTKPYGCGIKY